MTMLTKDKIEDYAARIADPELVGIPKAMTQIIGHLDGDDMQAVLTRAEEIAIVLGKAAFAEADELEAFVRLRRASRH
jgi:hypothetical protein